MSQSPRRQRRQRLFRTAGASLARRPVRLAVGLLTVRYCVSNVEPLTGAPKGIDALRIRPNIAGDPCPLGRRLREHGKEIGRPLEPVARVHVAGNLSFPGRVREVFTAQAFKLLVVFGRVGHDAEFPPLMHDELAAKIFENGRVEASSSATCTVPVCFWACTPISTLTISRQRFLDGRGVIESVLRPEGSLDSGNGPKSGVAPWLRKTGKRRSRLRLCARERRRSARERRDARSARRPRPQAPVPKCPGGSARKSGHPPSPVKHGRQASDSIYQKRLSALYLCRTRKRVLLLRK